MMAQPEASFKVCGLCSQLVDESVKLDDSLREFLVRFLDIDNTDLPAKVCTDCYQGTLDTKKFREKCSRTLDKLKKTNLSESMILGRSAGEMRGIKKTSKGGKVKNNKVAPAEKLVESVAVGPTGRPSRRHVNSNIGKAINESIESVFEPVGSRRISRREKLRAPSPAASTGSSGIEDRKMLPSVVLSNKDRERAESFLGLRSRGGRVLKRKTPYSPPKEPEVTPASTSRSKKVRGSISSEADDKPAQPSPARRIPSRKSGAKLSQDEDASKKGGNTVQYYIDNGGAAADQPEIIDVEDGDEEIFPSLGPYQCEICQSITDTKQEFVAHIKALHKDMVDEAVLNSLESDLKKRKKKEVIKGEKTEKQKVKDGKKLPTPAKAQPISRRPKKRKSKVEDDDLEYRPGGVKKYKKAGSKLPLAKTETAKSPSPKKTEPTDCPICGTHLARESDLSKHQETLKCRQAAYNLATTKAAAAAAAETEETTDDKGTKTQSPDEGNSNCSVDAKFKANIAKRYEAELGSGEGGEAPVPEETKSVAAETVDTSQYVPEPDDEADDDNVAAIRAALQESLETAEDDSHSPAAYIDPTPQPDMEPPPVDSEALHCKSGSSISPADLESRNRPQHRDSLDSQMAALHGPGGTFPSPSPFNMTGAVNFFT